MFTDADFERGSGSSLLKVPSFERADFIFRDFGSQYCFVGSLWAVP
jgi:hypothetical protein